MHLFLLLRQRSDEILVRFVIVGIVCLFCTGFAAAAENKVVNDQPIPVFVSILPQSYFVQRVGGDRVRVEVLVRPGASPATYAPTPKQMARLARARVFFRIGVPFENALLPKIRRTMPHLRIVDTGREIRRVPLNKGTGEKTRELDPHIWLDPLLVKKQAAVIMETLVAMDPAGKAVYTENYNKFAEDLNTLDKEIRTMLAPVAGKTVFVYHPAYGYFCRAYGLYQKAVETGGKNPTSKHLAHLIKEAKEEGVRAIFVQPQFSRKKARVIARAIGGRVIVFDPLAYDYITNLYQVAKRLAQVL